MAVVSAEEKARRRAEALKKLEATRKRLGMGPQPSKVQKNHQTASSSASVGGNNSSGNHTNSEGSNKISSSNRDASKKVSGLLTRPYIEYDMSTLKDTKAGFLIPEEGGTERWLDRLPQQIPPLPLDHPDAPACFECGIKELDFRMYNVFKTRVCVDCRKKLPEKYSLLTKTECKADYLLTEPELKDTELLPHMERPNPHQETYSNMMLYMRYQAEEVAFKKWGGEEGLDAEYERRETNKAARKKKKFESKLKEMRNKTRAQAITKTNFDRHEHKWTEETANEDGTTTKKCYCGMVINVVNI